MTTVKKTSGMRGRKTNPSSNKRISEDIAQLIIDLISTGHLKPGERLPAERELCKSLGASRSSLREALRCLSIVGILTARVGDGTSVAPDGRKFLEKIIEWRSLTEKHDIENLIEVRMGLELLSAANAAVRRTDLEIVKLDELLAGMKATLHDAVAFKELDLAFHLTISTASRNAMLIDLILLIRGQLTRGLSRVLLLPDALPLSLKEHTKIAKAIKRGDAEGASEAMREHLQAALDRYHSATQLRSRPVARKSAKR